MASFIVLNHPALSQSISQAAETHSQIFSSPPPVSVQVNGVQLGRATFIVTILQAGMHPCHARLTDWKKKTKKIQNRWTLLLSSKLGKPKYSLKAIRLYQNNHLANEISYRFSASFWNFWGRWRKRVKQRGRGKIIPISNSVDLQIRHSGTKNRSLSDKFLHIRDPLHSYETSIHCHKSIFFSHSLFEKWNCLLNSWYFINGCLH